MSTSLTRRLSRSAEPVRQVAGNANLRRLCLALVALETSTPAFGIALYVFAFAHGGAGEVGLVGLMTMVPAAVAAPFAALVADRARRERVIAVAALGRALLLGAAAAAAVVGWPAAVIYTLAAFASIANRVVFPARAALVPLLTGSEGELAAANAATSTIENLGFVAGPALAGIAVAAAGPAIVFALAALMTLLASSLAAGIRPRREPAPVVGARNIWTDLIAGFRTIANDRTLRLVIALYTGATAAFGILLVLVVGLAVDVLRIGAAGVGALNGSLGAGGVAGGIVALALASRLRPGAGLTAAALLFGLPLALLALWPQAASALVLLAAAGAGGVILDVACYTLVQQATSDEVRARVFGVLEGLAVGAVGLGAALGGVLATSVGVRGALVVAASIPVLGGLATMRPSFGGASNAHRVPIEAAESV